MKSTDLGFDKNEKIVVPFKEEESQYAEEITLKKISNSFTLLAILISWWVFVSAGTVALLIAFVTVSFQSIKAAVANPVKSLRSE